jgi:hypothetical protein
MSELDKLMAFGSWLQSKKIQHGAELYSLSVNTRCPLDAIRLKAGHLEATQHILDAFASLYNGDINKFMQEYLGQASEEEDKESPQDGPG